MTPPCGVPATGFLTVPSSITPASSHFRRSFNTLRSEIRSATIAISFFWSMLSKYALMSASSTKL
jgi:hypothetical protein